MRSEPLHAGRHGGRPREGVWHAVFPRRADNTLLSTWGVLKTGPQVNGDGATLSPTPRENNNGTSLVKNVIGGTEEDTTGSSASRNGAEGASLFRDSGHDADTKPFSTTLRHRPSTIDGLLRATNVSSRARSSWRRDVCGRRRRRAGARDGAHVVVTESGRCAPSRP